MGVRQVTGQRHALKGHGHPHDQAQHGDHATQAMHALPATMVDDPRPVLTGHDLPVACRQHGHRHQHGAGGAHQHAVPEIHRVDVIKRSGVQGRAQPVQPAGELRQQPGGQMKEVQHGADDTEPRISESGKSGKKRPAAAWGVALMSVSTPGVPMPAMWMPAMPIPARPNVRPSARQSSQNGGKPVRGDASCAAHAGYAPGTR